jgi:hypothetical protein
MLYPVDVLCSISRSILFGGYSVFLNNTPVPYSWIKRRQGLGYWRFPVHGSGSHCGVTAPAAVTFALGGVVELHVLYTRGFLRQQRVNRGKETTRGLILPTFIRVHLQSLCTVTLLNA